MDKLLYNKQAHGMGMWSFPATVDRDAATRLKRAKAMRALGITWYAPRVGDHGKLTDFSEPQFNELCKVYLGEGLQVLPWWYSRPQFYLREVGLASRLLELGAAGVIIDAEAEWTGHHVAAQDFGVKMRAAVGDAYVAHAPLAWLPYHGQWPYLEFGTFCDQVMPQTYWTELRYGKFDDGRSDDFDSQVLPQWEAMSKAGDVRAKNYAPIAVTYGRSDMLRLGQPAKNAPPGEFKAEDLQAFLARYTGHAEELGGVRRTLSFYSIDAANPAALTVIASHTKARQEADTTPLPNAKKGSQK